MKKIFLTLIFTILLTQISRADAPADPGLYATFHTNRGTFTCSLFFQKVPMTVANFVGLVEGSRPWIDLATGQARSEPFYNGLTFHRVMADFMIQGGSRNGQGTDGPGYRFPDEFAPDLIHAEPGILSMANSGFDSNGSQFFITVVPTEWLNYKHAVFGKIVDGMAVVNAISETPTGSSDNPLDPVVIDSVAIHRIGAAALAFDIQAQGLPKIQGLSSDLTINEDEYTLHFSRQEDRDYTLSYSNDLRSWQAGTIPATGESPGTGTYNLTSLASQQEQQFYRLTEVDYSAVDYGFLPEKLIGMTLEMKLSTNNTFLLHIDDERTEENAGEPLGSGTVDSGETALLSDYLFYHEDNRGRLLFILHGFAQINADLKFIDQNSGTFTGRVLTSSPFDVHGTFTLAPQ